MRGWNSFREDLSRFPSKSVNDASLRPAAVLLPLFEKGGEEQLLFTLRTDGMKHHRGEISFPGGVRDEEDPDLCATALRETNEELGVAAGDVMLLGRLDDFISVHGYCVSPFVGVIPHPYPLTVNAAEIAEVIEIPLRVLSEPDRWREENWRHRGRSVPVPFCNAGSHEIWGLTAEILRQFLRRTGHL